MYRYYALIWDYADQRSARAALLLAERLESASPRHWSRAVDEKGLLILHADAGARAGTGAAGKTHVLPEGAGAVLGDVFRRDAQNQESLARIVPGDLLERYWGRYVAIIRNPNTGEVWVLRDPSGGLPCLLTTYEGVNLVFSDMEDCVATGLPKFSVNWKYITRFVAHSGLQVRETALNEVTEILPGERVRFSGSALERSIEWNPIDIARRDPLENAGEATAALHATTRSCVQTWAAPHQDIVHNLSGGLDSSIVLSCLVSAPTRPSVTCLHYFATGPNEDERKYARTMASHAGVKLVERQLNPKAVKLEGMLNLRRSARPWFYMYELEHGEFESELAAERGAGALFSGAGGDGVFFQAGAELAVADYLFQHGLGRGLLRTSVDAARVSRKSVWPLLARAVRDRFIPRSWDSTALAIPLPRTIVSSDVLRSAKRDKGFVHPWFTKTATRGVPPGTLWHATSIHVPPAYYSSFSRGQYPERVFPLLSQPLVELCLRIPTWLLIREGRDRAIARRAFANDLPGEIVRRHAKGRIDHHVRNILDANLDFVRELLLDGVLVREGLLDRRNLELYLTRDSSPADFQYSEILQVHLCVEVWLRSWITSSCGSPG